MLALGTLLYSSCKHDYLEVQTIKADITTDKLYSNYTYVQQQMWNTYSYLPDGFAGLDLDAATNEAEATNSVERVQAFNYGTWNQYNNPDDVWAQ
jgi:hypothetical protein